MEKLAFKLTFGAFAFLTGISVISLWYFSREWVTQQSSSNGTSLVKPTSETTFKNPCDYPRPQNRKLEAKEAVYLAECFIIQNGYTELLPIANKSELTPENVYPGTDEEGLKMRHDSLEREAYSYRRSEIYDGGWEVLFRYKPHPEVIAFYGDRLNNVGRAVIVDDYGKQIKVQHSDRLLKMPDSQILNP